ncbi:MAG: hypothetical protein WAM79_02025 [Candidatus Sulfotelmatobacter sp.]
MEKRIDQQTGSESKAGLVEQVNGCLRSGEYSRALDLLRGAAADFPNDPKLAELEKLAHDGIQRKAEADRLITDSQELFARQKSAEAIQLLRKAYELDKRNSLARSILANALVEHAHSVVETNWLEAEKLTKQALDLNPAHPTAKTIHSLIVDQKKNSSVEDWVKQAGKLQASGDLFAALAWVAEGLAVHPDDHKLLQIQDSIQRDQGARRRQARRGDLEDLRRMELEIEGAADAAAKQALAERIQGVAAKYWTDGEILAIANGLLNRLGLVPQEGSIPSKQGKGAPVIFHVPRPSAPKSSPADNGQVAPSEVPLPPVSPNEVSSEPATSGGISDAVIPPPKVPPSAVKSGKVPAAPSRPKPSRPQVVPLSAAEFSAPAAKVKSPASQPKQPTKSKSTMVIFICAAAIILVAATFFFTRGHYAAPVAKAPAVAPAVSGPSTAAPRSAPTASGPPVPAPAVSSSEQITAEPALSVLPASPENGAEKVTPADQPPVEAARGMGSLVVVTGQNDARVFLNGKVQRQLTRGGQLRLLNVEPRNYVVQVSKSGFQDPPQQKIRIRKGEEASLIFNLQPQPHLAALSVRGGTPGTAVLVDQTPVGSIQPDGTLSVSTVNPGDHTIELRKERFKLRQFKKHFVAGGTISLAAADAALEAAPGELRITFTPADANVALVKGDLLKVVSSGVPLNLAPGSYTLTARTAERFTRSSTVEVVAGQSRNLVLSLAPNGMSKWEDPGAWKQEKESFIRKGGDFVLYGVVPTAGTFVFSAMPTKSRLLQWVINYTDPKNYVLFQMGDNGFSRTVIRNGTKTDEVKVPDKSDKKSFRTLQIRVSPTEIVHQIKHGNSWSILDRWTQPGANLSQGKFGFYIPGNDQVALSGFAHYGDLNTR